MARLQTILRAYVRGYREGGRRYRSVKSRNKMKVIVQDVMYYDKKKSIFYELHNNSPIAILINILYSKGIVNYTVIMHNNA